MNLGITEKAKDKTTEYYKNLETWFRDDFQRKRTLWLFVLTFGSIVSSIFTIWWFRSQAVSDEAVKLTTAMALFSEICKYSFLINGWKNIKKNCIFGSISTIIAICFLGFSILASGGKLYTEKESKNNTAYVESESYKTKQDTRSREEGEYNITKEKYAQLNKELSNLKDNRENEISKIRNTVSKKYESQIQSYKKRNIITNGSQPLENKREDEISKEIGNYDQRIESLEIEIGNYLERLDIISGKLQSTEKDIINSKSDLETGYGSYYSSFVSKNVARKLDGITYLVFGILVEISIMVLSFYVFVVLPEEFGINKGENKYNCTKKQPVINKPVEAISANEMPEFKYKPSTEKSNKNLSFEIKKQGSTDIEGISSKDIKLYLDIIYSNAKLNKLNELQCPGVSVIAKLSGLKSEQIRTIKGMLERHEIISSITAKGNNRTIIKKSRKEVGI